MCERLLRIVVLESVEVYVSSIICLSDGRIITRLEGSNAVNFDGTNNTSNWNVVAEGVVENLTRPRGFFEKCLSAVDEPLQMTTLALNFVVIEREYSCKPGISILLMRCIWLIPAFLGVALFYIIKFQQVSSRVFE